MFRQFNNVRKQHLAIRKLPDPTQSVNSGQRSVLNIEMRRGPLIVAMLSKFRPLPSLSTERSLSFAVHYSLTSIIVDRRSLQAWYHVSGSLGNQCNARGPEEYGMGLS